MHGFIGRGFLLGVALMVVAPLPAQAIPAISCHCFTDRSYDAAKPAAADPYFLATTQNTFFAMVFNTDKKSVVLMKQQGIPADDLWVAYWVASRSANEVDRLLEARAKGDSWPDILTPMQLSPENLGARFANAVATNLPADQMAAVVVDGLLTGYQLLEEGQLDALRKAGASNQELILATVLANRTGQAVQKILLDVRSGARSWGAMLQAAGIDGKNLQHEVASTLRLPRSPAPQRQQE